MVLGCELDRLTGRSVAAFGQDEAGRGKEFDAVFFNAVFGNIYDQGLALERVGQILSRHGVVVIRCGC
jgi:hypothetical protein